MTRKLTFALIAVAIIAVAVGAVASMRSSSNKTASNDLSSLANTYPVPEGATMAFPDSVSKSLVTKGWRAKGTIDDACTAWREAYRGWLQERGTTDVGSVTGDNEAGRRCSLSSKVSGYDVNLSLAVYGDDTTPNATLTVRKP